MKYDRFAFSIETAEVFCPQARIGIEGVAYDFDKSGNVLNIVPKIRTIFPILSNSPGENLFNVICPIEKSALRDRGIGEQSRAASTATTTTYKDAFTGMELIFVEGGCFERNAGVEGNSAQKGLKKTLTE